MQVLENEILTQIENTKKKTEGIMEVKTWFLEYLEIFKKIEGGFWRRYAFLSVSQSLPQVIPVSKKGFLCHKDFRQLLEEAPDQKKRLYEF